VIHHLLLFKAAAVVRDLYKNREKKKKKEENLKFKIQIKFK